MKYIKYILLTLFIPIISCDYEDERLDFLSDEENRPSEYYAWSNADTASAVEGNGVTIRLSSIWTLSTDDTSVEIELSGDAVSEIGTDITITNATTVAGGDPGNINDITINDNVISATINNRDTLTSVPLDLLISVEEDGVTDGDKVLVFTITSVSRDGSSLGAGDNNGERVTKVVNIVDADCPSDLSGTYTSGNSCFSTDSSNPDIVETANNGIYNIDDFTGGFYAFAGAPEVPAVLKDACGNLSIDDFVAFGVLEFVNMTGTDNGDGTLTITWTEASGFGNGGTPVTCTTTLILQ
ncbi:MAG TPA: hypothetical protein DDX98_12155 [Bacteroidales bacterium]|jgi:hypothetical protein|nr:hypothetical protein [Bacteroidales bacterium]